MNISKETPDILGVTYVRWQVFSQQWISHSTKMRPEAEHIQYFGVLDVVPDDNLTLLALYYWGIIKLYIFLPTQSNKVCLLWLLLGVRICRLLDFKNVRFLTTRASPCEPRRRDFSVDSLDAYLLHLDRIYIQSGRQLLEYLERTGAQLHKGPAGYEQSYIWGIS